jgi:hypothetical protein
MPTTNIETLHVHLACRFVPQNSGGVDLLIGASPGSVDVEKEGVLMLISSTAFAKRKTKEKPEMKQKPEMKMKFLLSLACTLLIATCRAVLFFIPLWKKIFHVVHESLMSTILVAALITDTNAEKC